jgi:hypothetical protein
LNPVDTNAIQTPTSPLGNFPELANMYRSNFQSIPSNAQTSAQAQADQTTVANAKAAASQKASNYQQIARPDGGFGFYDPNGQEITAAQYASATGKAPGDVLKNSTNPIDIGYQKDFKDLQDYINLKLQSSKDTAAKQKATAIEQDVQKNYKINISKMTPAQLIQQFQSAYPTVYGANQGNAPGVPSGHTFIPQATNSFVQNSGGGAFNL